MVYESVQYFLDFILRFFLGQLLGSGGMKQAGNKWSDTKHRSWHEVCF